MDRASEITAMVTAEIAREPIKTQDDCCRSSAVVSCRYETRPWTDAVVLEVAADMARGLFGPAFEAASYDQRSEWIDMCERELRREIARQS